MLVAACGGNNNSISSSGSNPGAGALGANVDMKNCQVGQSYSTQYGCLNRGICQPGAGFSTQAGSCVTGQVVTGAMKFGNNAGTRHFGTLTISNVTQMSLLLQNAGLCNAGYGSMQIMAAGSLNCAQYTSRGAFAAVTSYSGSIDNVNIAIGAGVPTLTYDLAANLSALNGSPLALYGSQASPYSAGQAITFSQQSRNFSYNNGNGMQIVGVSPSGETISLMLIVESGSLGLDHLNGKLVYQGVEVATVSLDRF